MMFKLVLYVLNAVSWSYPQLNRFKWIVSRDYRLFLNHLIRPIPFPILVSKIDRWHRVRRLIGLHTDESVYFLRVKQWFHKGRMKQGFDEEEMQSERASESHLYNSYSVVICGHDWIRTYCVVWDCVMVTYSERFCFSVLSKFND